MAALQELWFAEFMVASLFSGISNGNQRLPKLEKSWQVCRGIRDRVRRSPYLIYLALYKIT